MSQLIGDRWKKTGRTLGRGGQAPVYVVTDVTASLPGEFALKELAPNRPPEAYERFRREISALRLLDHPNVIKIIDHSEHDGQPQFYVMEYLRDAVTLDKQMKEDRNPFAADPIAALAMFEQLLHALQCCHSLTPFILHRDLKPGNVLVLPDMSIKVIDFGLCQFAGTSTITLVDEGVGTQNYMAPECESGAEGGASLPADLYSAAKVLWSAITNRRAFAREAPVFAGMSMQELFPNKPSTWHLQHIFRHMIRRAPSDRWQNAADPLYWTQVIRELIVSARKPIELIWKSCPICGVGSLGKLEKDYLLFANPMPNGFVAVECTSCGACLLRNVQRHRETLAHDKSLD